MKTTILLLAAVAAFALPSCSVVQSVSRTAKNVLGVPESAPAAQPLGFGGVRNEYHAALERRKQDVILEILNSNGGAQ